MDRGPLLRDKAQCFHEAGGLGAGGREIELTAPRLTHRDPQYEGDE